MTTVPLVRSRQPSPARPGRPWVRLTGVVLLGLLAAAFAVSAALLADVGYNLGGNPVALVVPEAMFGALAWLAAEAAVRTACSRTLLGRRAATAALLVAALAGLAGYGSGRLGAQAWHTNQLAGAGCSAPDAALLKETALPAWRPEQVKGQGGTCTLTFDGPATEADLGTADPALSAHGWQRVGPAASHGEQSARFEYRRGGRYLVLDVLPGPGPLTGRLTLR